MKNFRTQLTLVFLLLITATLGSANSPKGVKAIFPDAGYKPTKPREVVFVIPEIGCYSSSKSVMEYANNQDQKATKVLIIAESIKALKYGDRFKPLTKVNPLFVETSKAQQRGLFLDGPVFAFLEGGSVVEEIQISCETFENAKAKVTLFLHTPYDNRYKEANLIASGL